MGRPRQFDEDRVIASAAQAFAVGGYHGTSMDDLLRATGLQRSSLYQAFGSKRGLFLAALTHADGGSGLELVLVALMDLAGSDEEIRDMAVSRLRAQGDVERVLGRSLLLRAGIASASDGGRERKNDEHGDS